LAPSAAAAGPVSGAAASGIDALFASPEKAFYINTHTHKHTHTHTYVYTYNVLNKPNHSVFTKQTLRVFAS
jgi:hypothetical protein